MVVNWDWPMRQILMREDLINLTNSKYLPLFITATCEFSRFDDLLKDEAGNISKALQQENIPF